jgi:hypothetical protein
LVDFWVEAAVCGFVGACVGAAVVALDGFPVGVAVGEFVGLLGHVESCG